MIKIMLLTKSKDEIVDGKRVCEYVDKPFMIDASLNAQMRFEANFPALAKNEDLVTYTERIAKDKSVSMPTILAKMKTLYCYFNTTMTFCEFLSMFDLSDNKIMDDLTSKLKNTFEIIEGSAAEKN